MIAALQVWVMLAAPASQLPDRAALEAEIIRAIAEVGDNACEDDAALLAVVDDDRAGHKLEQLLSEFEPHKHNQRLHSPQQCQELLAAARAHRLRRLVKFDVTTDLRHPSQAVRIFAVRAAPLLLGKKGAPKLLPLLADDDREVRSAAIRSVTLMQDVRAVKQLTALADAYGDEACEACVALDALGRKCAIENGEEAGPMGGLVGRIMDGGPCARVAGHGGRPNLTALVDVLKERLRDSADAVQMGTVGWACEFPEELAREPLRREGASPTDKAIAAAVLLWRAESPPPVSRAPAKAARLDDQLLRCEAGWTRARE